MELSADSSTPAGEPEQTQPGQPRYQAILLAFVCVAAALWIDSAGFHRPHDRDSIVPVMVSLYRWIPFYWEQDRLGMLVPLLAIPFRSPLANLLVQSAVNASCGLAAFFLSARYVMREGWIFTGAVSAAGFLWFNTKQALFQYLGSAQPYGVGLCLGLAGLLLLENAKRSRPLRISASLIFLLAASWVDAAVIFVLLPLVLFRCYLDGSVPTTFMLRAKRCLNSNVALALALIFLSFLSSYVFSGIVSSSAAYGDWPYSPMQPWRWPAVWIEFGKTAWSEYLSQGDGIVMALLLVMGVLLRLWRSLRTHAPNSAAANLLISSLISFLLMGSLSHVKSTGLNRASRCNPAPGWRRGVGVAACLCFSGFERAQSSDRSRYGFIPVLSHLCIWLAVSGKGAQRS